MNMVKWRFVVVAAMVANAATSAFAGPLGIVDDFNTPGLGEYTLTRILDNGVATANVSFSDATGSLVASYSGTPNAAEQVVFLRNDYSLGVGERLVVDVAQATSTTEMDFGLAVSATATPSSVMNPTPTDVRNTFDWLAVYVRPSQNAVRVTSSINGTVTTAANVLSADETTVKNLFIQRVSATQFNVGYTNTSDVQFINNGGTPYSFTAANVGTAIGFYADLRSAGQGTTSLGPLDNLRLVPEPAAGLLACAALLGRGWLRKRLG